MIKLNKNLLLIVALVGGAFGFTNCSTAPTTNTTNGNTAVVTNTNTTKTTTTTTETKTETAGDKVGVPECDEYIAKYEACINSKVPEAQRAMYKSSFDTMRKSWKDAAATPQGKAGLATGCKQALDTAKQSMSAFACAW